MSYKSIACFVLLAMSGSALAEGEEISVHGGTVQFTGSIVNAPCSVEIGSNGVIAVELGQYRADSFAQTGDTSPARPFNITLKDCVTDTFTKASVTFAGDAIDKNTLAVDGGATGVGIQILKNGQTLNVDGTTSSPESNLLEGENHLQLHAQYISIADNVTAGMANSSADFTVTYL